VENHTIVGGLGSAVAEVVAEEHDEVILFRRLGLKDTYCMAYGRHQELKKLLNLDAESIAKAAEHMVFNLTSTVSRQ
jgi:transketolase